MILRINWGAIDDALTDGHPVSGEGPLLAAVVLAVGFLGAHLVGRWRRRRLGNLQDQTREFMVRRADFTVVRGDADAEAEQVPVSDKAALGGLEAPPAESLVRVKLVPGSHKVHTVTVEALYDGQPSDLHEVEPEPPDDLPDVGQFFVPFLFVRGSGEDPAFEGGPDVRVVQVKAGLGQHQFCHIQIGQKLFLPLGGYRHLIF